MRPFWWRGASPLKWQWGSEEYSVLICDNTESPQVDHVLNQNLLPFAADTAFQRNNPVITCSKITEPDVELFSLTELMIQEMCWAEDNREELSGILFGPRVAHCYSQSNKERPVLMVR
jgi:hypothetical protein